MRLDLDPFVEARQTEFRQQDPYRYCRTLPLRADMHFQRFVGVTNGILFENTGLSGRCGNRLYSGDALDTLALR